MEVVDYLFLFWCIFTGSVFLIGTLYEKHLRVKLKQTELKKKHSLKQQDYYNSRYREEIGTLNSWNSSSAHPTNYSSQLYNSALNDANNQQSTNLYNFQSLASSQEQSNLYRDYNLANKNNNQSEQSIGHIQNYSRGSFQITDADQRQHLNQYGLTSATSFDSSQHGYEATYGGGSHYPYDGHHHDNSIIPIATGFNQDCIEWVNNILYLFYTQGQKYGPIISESIYRSLNEKLSNITSSSTELNNLILEFEGINQQFSSRPELTNIRTETESEKSVSAICKIYNRSLSFDLTIKKIKQNHHHQQQQEQSNYNCLINNDETAHYELILENLEGKLKSVAMLSDKLIVVQFMEKPDTKILLRPKHMIGSMNNFKLISEDNLVNIILQTLTQVVVDLYFGEDPDFPQYNKHQSSSGYRNKLNLLKGGANELKRQIKHDFFGSLTTSSENKERKVFIKILKASNINYNQNVTCLLELDVPHQQAISSTKQGSNPFWDEHFLFNINEKSNELSIELWDSINLPIDSGNSPNFRQKRSHQRTSSWPKKWNKSEVTATAKFLGSVRIQVEDLRREPVQKVSLILQPSERPSISGLITSDLSNSVGGELQLELLFLEHSSNSSSSHTSGHGSQTNSLTYQQGDVVSVDRKLTPAGYVITTTTIVKPPTSIASSMAHQTANTLNRLDQLPISRTHSPVSSERSDIEINLDRLSQIGGDNQLSPQQQQQQQQDLQTNLDSQSSVGGHRSRSRSRSRSFLRAIRKRFSFSRTRSRSVGGEHSPALTGRSEGARSGLSSQQSIESRSRTSSINDLGRFGERAESVPASRNPGEVPIIVINKGRLSDTASAFTFTHPKSQLVIECLEPKMGQDGSTKERAQIRHYAIPESESNKSKWRKRGLKLHVFNEHQFVATHLAGSSTCHLCGRVFSRRPGKQGYKCRNCHLLSHKQCHVKVDHTCPHVKKDGLKIEYIDADPPAILMDSTGSRVNTDGEHSNSYSTSVGGGTLPLSGQQNRQTNKTSRFVAKSISMEIDDSR